MKNCTVIGAGLMGTQIAMTAAMAGFNVYVQDIDASRLTVGKEQLYAQMEKYIAKGLVAATLVEKAKERLHFEASLEKAIGEADFVIEAIVENLALKQQLFQQLDQLAPKHAVLATNSSMIVSSKLAPYTSRPENVCNIHFFNPIMMMEVVEIVQGPHTSDATIQLAIDFVKRLQKTPLVLKKEITGFIANRILGKMMNEAMYLLEEGIATVEEIDLACTKALNHPIGPFTLMDLTGIDTAYAIQQTQYELEEYAQEPSPLLKEKLDNGQLGRKTGQGFYTYR